jgi:hypothetical protein
MFPANKGFIAPFCLQELPGGQKKAALFSTNPFIT